MVVAILWTDHLLSPLGTTVKHVGFECAQVVQKPFAFSLHVPVPMLALPRSADFGAMPFVTGARGSRVIFPSGVKVILNLRPDGVLAVKAWPVKKVA
jgi:hypothetical protein